MAANSASKLGVIIPLSDVSGAPKTVRRFAQEAEALEYHQ